MLTQIQRSVFFPLRMAYKAVEASRAHADGMYDQQVNDLIVAQERAAECMGE
jgi:hypothetical protein